jgi:hypothetical protein
MTENSNSNRVEDVAQSDANGKRLAELEAVVRVLRDKEEIRQVLVRYCRANDRADEELLRSCYHPDARERSGPFEGSAEEMVPALISAGLEAFESMFWAVTETDIQVDGDTARVEAYHISAKVMRERGDDGERMQRLSGVRFLDRFERRNGEWRIAMRTMVSDWGVFVPTPTGSFGPYKYPLAEHGYTLGATNKTDPSYHF